MSQIQMQLKSHEQRLNNTEDDIRRAQLSNSLRINGFAVKENENLLDLFEKIAAEIGFAIGEKMSMPMIERMPTRNATTGQIMPSPTILIHFASIQQKKTFYSLYLNKMPLDSSKFGLPTDTRVIIGENLTYINSKLFKEVLILRREKKIMQAFTEDGIVKIRFVKGKNQPTFTIRSQIELETIVAKHESQMKTNESNTNANPVITPSQVTPQTHNAITAPGNNNNTAQTNTPMDVQQTADK